MLQIDSDCVHCGVPTPLKHCPNCFAQLLLDKPVRKLCSNVECTNVVADKFKLCSSCYYVSRTTCINCAKTCDFKHKMCQLCFVNSKPEQLCNGFDCKAYTNRKFCQECHTINKSYLL